MGKSDFDFGPMLETSVGRSTVGFVTVDSGVPLPLGSGTLVKCNGAQGILTCAHVLCEAAKNQEIGIVVFPVVARKLQQLKVSAQPLISSMIAFYDQPETRDGRDLAFLPLPLALMSDLEASASVLDLDVHSERASAQKPDGTIAVEVAAGVVAERTAPAAIKGQTLVLSVEGLINVGKFSDTRWSKDFDLIELEPKSALEFQLPSTYGGTSGGGMWRLYVRDQGNGTYSLVESRLVGVVFWETEPPNRNLIGHGPVSIYGHLLSEIRSGGT